MYYLNYFFIFSIFGYLYETILYKIKHVKRNSGFLYGPWAPIYGLGALIIVTLTNTLKIKRMHQVISFMIIVFFLFTLIEYIGGKILKFLFHKDYWDYTKHKYNIGKYISLDVSIIWVVESLIFLYLKKYIDVFIVMIPSIVTVTILFVFIFDFLYTLIK